MSLQKHINILLEDSKRIDAQPESDLRLYARLLANVKAHEEELEKRKSEVQDFARMFELFEMPADDKNSVHSDALKKETVQERSEIEKNNAEIARRKDYYTALKDGDYERLWRNGDEENQIAAVYCAFGNSKGAGVKRSTVETVKWFLDKRSSMSEAVAKYLIEKALIAGEQKNCSESERKEIDTLAMQIIRQFAPNSGDKLWQSMERCISIHETERLLAECETVLKEYESLISGLDTFVSAYRTSESNMTKELEQVCSGNLSGRASESATRARNWLRDSISEMNEEIKKCQRQTRDVEKGIKSLEAVKETLQAGQEEGVEQPATAKLAEEIALLKKQLSEYTAVSSLEEKQKAQMAELAKQISYVQDAVRADAEEALERSRRRVERRKNRINRRRSWRIEHPILNFFRRVLVIIVLWWVVMDRTAWWFSVTPWEMNGSTLAWKDVYEDLYYSGYTPTYGDAMLSFGDCILELKWGRAKRALKQYYLEQNKERVVSADGVLEIPEKASGTTVKTVSLSFMPENLTKLIIPEGVEKLDGLWRAYNLQEVVIPESLEEITGGVFANCDLKEVDFPYVKNMSTYDAAGKWAEGIFANCELLERVNLPALETISGSAFADCSNLREVRLDSLKAVEGSTFYNCSSLTDVAIPVAESIGHSAFKNCTSLTEVKLPAVTHLYEAAFIGCTNLQKVYIGGNITQIEEHYEGSHSLYSVFPIDAPDLEFVLDSNATYPEHIIATLQLYNKPITYVDFNTIDF